MRYRTLKWVLPSTLWLLVFLGVVAQAQTESPIISGGAGFISTTNGGITFFQPVVAPVLAAPIGSKFLVESRADLRGLYMRENFTSGPYQGEFIATLEYLQLDYVANSKLTLSVGRYLTPFNTYNERLTPIWIRNLQDPPLIFPIGTRTTGSSDGAMIRGAAVSNADVQLNYTAYISALSTVEQFESARAAGGRIGLFLTKPRLEIGGSYQRFLQDQEHNAVGFYGSWQPRRVPLDVKGEYAHSPSGQGYWVEGAFRFTNKPVPATWLSRFQTVVRMQQFFRDQLRPNDFLPATNTQRVDVGLNYYLPQNVRLNASYGRQLDDRLDRNVWNVAITYRFLVPLFPGGSR